MKIELSSQECDLLDQIAGLDGITSRQALSQAIYLLASKVDYTLNIKLADDLSKSMTKPMPSKR